MSQSGEAAEHPGTLTFLDEDTGTERVRAVGEVPATIAWATDAAGRTVPVVRVVSHRRGAQRIIQSFGADGALLSRTVQAPPPGPPR